VKGEELRREEGARGACRETFLFAAIEKKKKKTGKKGKRVVAGGCLGV